jgi:hypothetical protein
VALQRHKPTILDTLAPGQMGTRTLWYQDKSAPGQFGTSIRQIGIFLIMSVPEKILIMRTILLHCIQLSSDIVKLKEVFLPHPFYHVSGLLLKIFSIWLAHALGSGMDSKNNKNPYTVIFFHYMFKDQTITNANTSCKHLITAFDLN